MSGPEAPVASGGVSGPFIRRPVATWLMMAAILIAGLAAYLRLPVAPLPQIDFPTIQITASLPGASPETMASSVAQPLERQFAQIPGLNELTSVSAIGATTITAEFDLDRNIDAAAQDVQAAINAAAGDLPPNLPSPPSYRKTNPADARSCCCRSPPRKCRWSKPTTSPTAGSPSRSARSRAWAR
ncbi:efflux RND transporter permease subunit [Chenggangzhangella methanolivorans]|uniref:efflux RND transporter permease subunit n=1 Tax=Chenggangzhangella methanolivorans TaxID=1437009 RepID=UPI003D1818E1